MMRLTAFWDSSRLSSQHVFHEFSGLRRPPLDLFWVQPQSLDGIPQRRCVCAANGRCRSNWFCHRRFSVEGVPLSGK